eukprot:1014891-Rhodomonas_salina.1
MPGTADLEASSRVGSGPGLAHRGQGRDLGALRNTLLGTLLFARPRACLSCTPPALAVNTRKQFTCPPTLFRGGSIHRGRRAHCASEGCRSAPSLALSRSLSLPRSLASSGCTRAYASGSAGRWGPVCAVISQLGQKVRDHSVQNPLRSQHPTSQPRTA